MRNGFSLDLQLAMKETQFVQRKVKQTYPCINVKQDFYDKPERIHLSLMDKHYNQPVQEFTNQ
jgi:hypothetical protein